MRTAVTLKSCETIVQAVQEVKNRQEKNEASGGKISVQTGKKYL